MRARSSRSSGGTYGLEGARRRSRHARASAPSRRSASYAAAGSSSPPAPFCRAPEERSWLRTGRHRARRSLSRCCVALARRYAAREDQPRCAPSNGVGATSSGSKVDGPSRRPARMWCSAGLRTPPLVEGSICTRLGEDVHFARHATERLPSGEVITAGRCEGRAPAREERHRRGHARDGGRSNGPLQRCLHRRCSTRS